MWPFSQVTQFKAGGLLPSKVPQYLRAYTVPVGWQYPEYIDGRPYLLPSDDQGATSECAAYATSGIEEAVRWWRTGKRETLDPHPLYTNAKRIDGNANPGTSLDSIIQAAQEIGYLDNVDVYDIRSSLDLRYAIHKFPLILLGFYITDGWNRVSTNGNMSDGTKVLGGHAVVGCYYDDYGVGIVNSWGTKWGCQGRARLTWDQFHKQFLGAKGFMLRG